MPRGTNGHPAIKEEPDDSDLNSAFNSGQYSGMNVAQSQASYGTWSGNQAYSTAQYSNAMPMTRPQQSGYGSVRSGSSALGNDELMEMLKSSGEMGIPNYGQHQQFMNPNAPGMAGNTMASAVHPSQLQSRSSPFSRPTQRPVQPHTFHVSGTGRLAPDQRNKRGIGSGQDTPESGELSASVPIPTAGLSQNHTRTWETFSNESYGESPLMSPLVDTHQRYDFTTPGKAASVPVNPQNMPATTSEAKRAKRRMSHNMVERRRRDNINERIHDLAELLPKHRIDDDRTRKHPLHSSQNAQKFGDSHTSVLTPVKRGGAGTITQGLPIDEKQMAPAKGDVLNAAVLWAKDLIWLLNCKFAEESRLLETLDQCNINAPYEKSEDQQRMEDEVLQTIRKVGAENFSYSRHSTRRFSSLSDENEGPTAAAATNTGNYAQFGNEIFTSDSGMLGFGQESHFMKDFTGENGNYGFDANAAYEEDGMDKPDDDMMNYED